VLEQRALGHAHVLGDGGGGDLARVVVGGQRDHRIHGGGAALFGRQVSSGHGGGRSVLSE
jgi:hypothetical protein